MATQHEFYAAQAANCASQSAQSELPMLREKYQRAGAAWEALAQREINIAEAREKRLAELAEREGKTHGSQ